MFTHKIDNNIISPIYIFLIRRIRELPMSVLTVDHEAVKHFCLTLTNLLPSEEVEEKINPQLILEFCTTESTR